MIYIFVIGPSLAMGPLLSPYTLAAYAFLPSVCFTQPETNETRLRSVRPIKWCQGYTYQLQTVGKQSPRSDWPLCDILPLSLSLLHALSHALSFYINFTLSPTLFHCFLADFLSKIWHVSEFFLFPLILIDWNYKSFHARVLLRK